MTKEIIEDFRFIVIPYMVNRFNEINYEGQGVTDAKDFQDNFNEICDLAIKALEQEPKIDWNELKRKIFMEVDGGTDDKWLRYADVCDNISKSIDEFKADLPSVTPQEPRKGHWINTANPRMSDNIVCSECGYDSIADFKFCPCCGADMRVESENT